MNFNTRVKAIFLSLALFTTGYVAADATDDLIVAIDAGNVAGVKLALKQGANVDAPRILRQVPVEVLKATTTARDFARNSFAHIVQINQRQIVSLEEAVTFTGIGFACAGIFGLMKSGVGVLGSAFVGSVFLLISAVQLKQYWRWVQIYRLVSPEDKLKLYPIKSCSSILPLVVIIPTGMKKLWDGSLSRRAGVVTAKIPFDALMDDAPQANEPTHNK